MEGAWRQVSADERRLAAARLGNDVHVWKCDLAARLERLAEDGRLLGRAETDRANRFAFERDRQSFLARRIARRLLLAAYLGLEPAALTFGEDVNGKPFCTTAGADGLHFNASSSRTQALIAVSRSAPLGVDIEQVIERPGLEDVAAGQFSPSERNALARQPAGERLAAFYSIWTRKEAVVKALGHGLSLPLQQLTVWPPERHLSIDLPELNLDCRLELPPLPFIEGFQTAVALKGDPAQLKYFELLPA